MAVTPRPTLLAFALAATLTASLAAPAQQLTAGLPDAPDAILFPAPSAQASVLPVEGTILSAPDQPIDGASVSLSAPGLAQPLQTVADLRGHFRFPAVPAHVPLTFVVSAAGFATHTTTFDFSNAPYLTLTITLLPAVTADVSVIATQQDIGAAQVQAETRQRVLGIFPNYYVVYAGNVVPMTKKQKYTVAAKLEFDPVSITLTAIFAGVEQAVNGFPGYGQGAAGYFKRFGASMADGIDSTFLAGAILPTLFHQDPRYFYSGKGSALHRTLYAASSVVRTKGDNGRWQPNYSLILGNLGAAGVSNLYYPASDRHGAQLTVENSLIGTGLGAVGNIIEEFLIKHITPNLPDYTPTGSPKPAPETSSTP